MMPRNLAVDWDDLWIRYSIFKAGHYHGAIASIVPDLMSILAMNLTNI